MPNKEATVDFVYHATERALSEHARSKEEGDPRPEHLQIFRQIAKRAVELANAPPTNEATANFVYHATIHHKKLAEEVLRQEQRNIATWHSVDSMRIAMAAAMEVNPETLPGHEATVYSLCAEMIRLRKDFQELHDEHALDGVVPPNSPTTMQQLIKLSEIAITHANTTPIIDWISEKLSRDDSIEKRDSILRSLYHRVSNSISSPDPTQQEFIAAPIDILSGRAYGDADDIACAFAAALLTAGFDCYIVAHGYDGKPPTNALVKVRVTPWPSVVPEWRYLDVAAGRVHKHTSEIEGPLLTPEKAELKMDSNELKRVVTWVEEDSSRSFFLEGKKQEYKISLLEGDKLLSSGHGRTIDAAAHEALVRLVTSFISRVIEEDKK